MSENGNNSARSLGLRILFCVLISVLVLIPCFWLPRIEAGDLASHTYNSWLASLVVEGKAPGLWLAPLSNNIMFDTALSRLASLAGFRRGETIAVCISVLIVFWGSFALVSAVAERSVYFLLPFLFVLAYGWTFHMGFFNFYLAIGLSCAGLAVLWRAKRWGYLFVVPFIPLVWFAHPLGLAWMLAVGGCMILIKQLDRRWHILVALGALFSIYLLRLYLYDNFRTLGYASVYDLFGAGQVLLARRYTIIVMMILLAIISCLMIHLRQVLRSANQGTNGSRPGKTRKGSRRLRGQGQLRRGWTDWFPWPLQLYLVSVLALLNLPNEIWFPQYPSSVNFIASRFSMATAIMACCSLSALRTRTLFGLLSCAIALVYFTYIYQDERKIYELEQQAEALVHQLPEGARVFTTIVPFRDFRLYTDHVVDRACVGHCFNVGNYEASTGQFRVRAELGNGFVVTEPGFPKAILTGEYLITQSDLPGWHIFQCGPTEVDLCVRPLQPGRLSYMPPDQALLRFPAPRSAP